MFEYPKCKQIQRPSFGTDYHVSVYMIPKPSSLKLQDVKLNIDVGG